MSEPKIQAQGGVGPLAWWVVQGSYIFAKCRSIEVAQAALEAVIKDQAERRADVIEAEVELLDTIELNAQRHLITYPNSLQAKVVAAEALPTQQ